jgi:hypothetical protein
VVYELTGVLTPQDNFPNRNQANYGLQEKVDLTFTISPILITAAQAGDLRWKVAGGQGVVNGNNNGTDTFTAPGTAGSVWYSPMSRPKIAHCKVMAALCSTAGEHQAASRLFLTPVIAMSLPSK